MENKSGKHKISDMVKITGLPRTTINDWLQRYGQYLSYQVQGKRKLYSDRAIEIINEINELRNNGKNSFEIEEILAEKHPIKPEIAEESSSVETAVPSQKVSTKPKTGKVQPIHPQPTEEFAVIAKKQTDEIARLLSDQLSNLTTRLEELEQNNRKLSKSSGNWMGFTILIVVVLFAAGGLIFWKYSQQVESNIILSRKHNATLNVLDNKEKDLSQKKKHIGVLSNTLAQTRKQYDSGMKKLKNSFEKDKVELENKISKDAEEKIDSYKKEVEAVREKFAKERIELLKKLTELKSNNSEKSEIIKKLQDQTLKMSEAFNKLAQNQEAKALEKAKQLKAAQANKINEAEKTVETVIKPEEINNKK